MTLYKRYKEDIEKNKPKLGSENQDEYVAYKNGYDEGVKQSYLNSIDCMIAFQEDWEKEYKDGSVTNHINITINDLQEQRKLIYES